METKHIAESLQEAAQISTTQMQSLKTDLESFDDVPLSDAEQAEALRCARERKFYLLQEQYKEARAAEVRRQLTEQWSYEKVRDFALWRAGRIFPEAPAYQDTPTSNAGTVFELLCLYFSRDPRFVDKAIAAKIQLPDLQKGIFLVGAVGTGKTTLMRLFSVNQRQVYMVRSAAHIADTWQADGEGCLKSMTELQMLPVNDADNFYHRFAGLCIDDVGTEDIKLHFGNRKNVIADLIMARYFAGTTGKFLHLTGNLTADQMKDFYGGRVTSRLREIVNVIHLTGEDRRK